MNQEALYIYIYIYIYVCVCVCVCVCVWARAHACTRNYIPIIYIRGSLNKFPDFFCMCTFIDNHRHHHVMPLARISLTLPRLFSRSLIASGRSSGLHPVSSHSCWIYNRAGCPAFARLYVGVHRNASLMSSSLLLQQSYMSSSSNLDSFRDGRQVAV